MRTVFVENHDSFSWNVIDLLPVPRETVRVVSSAAAIGALDGADALVIGPGPMDPPRAGPVELVHAAAQRRLPTLGICLGHQALGLAFGAQLVRTTPAHGKPAVVHFESSRLFPSVTGHLEVMRYHSLSLPRISAPSRVVAPRGVCAQREPPPCGDAARPRGSRQVPVPLSVGASARRPG